MSNLPNDNRVDVWFDQLEKAARHLPGEEREKLHQELRQHLESLVADKAAEGHTAEEAWAVSLDQLGNPGQIGRKVSQVWKEEQGGIQAEVGAISFGLGLHMLKNLIYMLIFYICNYIIENTDLIAAIKFHLFVRGTMIVDIVTLALIAFIIGRKYSFQAIKGALYSQLMCDTLNLFWLSVILFKARGHYSPSSMSSFLGIILLETPLWLGGHIGIAYLASVTKRGWYKPTLADFKLTLPRRWAAASR